MSITNIIGRRRNSRSPSPRQSREHKKRSSMDQMPARKTSDLLDVPPAYLNQRRKSEPLLPKIIVAIQTDFIDQTDQQDESVGRVDSYSHSLLDASKMDQSSMTGSQMDRDHTQMTGDDGGKPGNPALTLANAFLSINPHAIERRRSLVNIQNNTVTVLGPAKIGKSTIIQRLNLFSSSEGFLHPSESPVTFLEVTGQNTDDDQYISLCTGIVIIVFAMNNTNSLMFAKQVLCSDDRSSLGQHDQTTTILVSNKSDSRAKRESVPINNDLIEASLRLDIPYVEVSALMNQNMDRLWQIIKKHQYKSVEDEKHVPSITRQRSM